MLKTEADPPAPTEIDLEGSAAIGDFIKKSAKAANHLCATGQLPAYKLGGKWHMRPSRYREEQRRREDANLAKGQSTRSAAQN